MLDQPGTPPQGGADPYSQVGSPGNTGGTEPVAPANHGAGYAEGIPGQKQFVDETSGPAGANIKTAQKRQQPQRPKRSKNALIIVLAVIIIVGVVIVFVRPGGAAKTTTTQYTTINQNFQSISSCKNINAPGSYYLTGQVADQYANGSCIGIHSDNVKIVCNDNQIVGPGDTYIVGHASYGIGIYNASNVTVGECGISNFSYGVASFSSRNVRISGNNLTNNYEPIYFNDTAYSAISNNYIYGSTSPYGMIQLDSNSINNTVSNNTLNNSEYYGIRVNSTGNTFENNYISKNLYSFACGTQAGYPKSNAAFGNVCYNNTGCSFVKCNGVNIPNNVSLTVLNSNVSTCGSIIAPGTYELASNINAGDYIGAYNSSLYRVPCIRIAASDVRLYCNNHSISGSEYAIASAGTSNDLVDGCTLSNAEYGVYLSNTTSFNVSRSTLHGDTYGIFMNSSALTYVNGVRAENNSFAIYLSNSNAATVSGFDLSNNTFGVYLSNSSNNLLYSGRAFNNTEFDVYATNASAGLHSNLADSVSCGFTDALWAPCSEHISANMKYYPITTCFTISKPGNYSLVEDIVGSGNNCITIKSNNVALNCNGHSITAASGTTGAFMSIYNRKNVSVSDCAVYGYGTAISSSNSSNIHLLSITARASEYGIALSGVNNSTVNDSNITSIAGAGILANGLDYSTLNDNRVTYTKPNATGYVLFNSSNNIIMNNYDQYAKVGMEMAGFSTNNLVFNNTMQTNSRYDYECGGSASYIGSNNATYNYGVLNNCSWLAALNSASPHPACEPEFNPSTIDLRSDYVYTYGTTCYDIRANNFTLNCGGHVIVSTNGGTFATFVNGVGGIIENCKLKGFTNALEANNYSVRIVNSTIYGTGQNAGYGINVIGGRRSIVSRNSVYNAMYGIAVSNENYSTIGHNSVNYTGTAYIFEGVNDSTIEYNLAQYHNLIGAVIGNSSSDIFSNNVFNGTAQGTVCDSATSQCP
ncbi:MAG: right-handed parallel beta-helix repeat-containing protein [Candidatus Marsarchaeota archaeon]|nr:right-handed parallel beta-helix repeat-containing protein [Candidatus Marsarchaeota archaeon]